MTTKDYVKLARIFKGGYKTSKLNGVSTKEILDMMLKDLESVLRKDNPKFDCARFEDAIFG